MHIHGLHSISSCIFKYATKNSLGRILKCHFVEFDSQVSYHSTSHCGSFRCGRSRCGRAHCGRPWTGHYCPSIAERENSLSKFSPLVDLGCLNQKGGHRDHIMKSFLIWKKFWVKVWLSNNFLTKVRKWQVISYLKNL